VYTVSDSFLEAIRQSGKRKTVVDVYYGKGSLSQLIASDLPVVSGSITIDSKGNNRRSGSIVIGDPDLFPNLLNNTPIEPYGTEFVIKSGVTYADGTEELVPLGKFPIYTISGREEGGMFPEVRFFDRSKICEESGYLEPRDYSGKRCIDRIEKLMDYMFGDDGGPIDIHVGDDVQDIKLPGGSNFSENHWARIQKLAETMATEVFFDVNGDLVIQTPPFVDQSFPLQSAVFAIDPGDYGVLVSATRTITRDQTYNRIGVYGAPPNGNGTQPYGEATDSNPRSPTYFYGPFGKVTRSFQYPTLTRPSHCQRTADMLLRQHAGLTRSVDFGMLANPALDVGDIVLLEYPSDGIQELHIIDQITIPFDGGASRGKTRTLQY
jgi:hypothetical protein